MENIDPFGTNANENLTNNSEQKTDNAESIEAINSLKSLRGAEFIEKLKELYDSNPGFETVVDNFKGDTKHRKNISHALFYIKMIEKETEKKLLGVDYYKERESDYYPENAEKDRRRDNRIISIPLAAVGGIILTVGIAKYQMHKESEENKAAEKQWETEKVPESLDQIELEADTIFQKLQNNDFIFEANDTLQKTIESHFENEYNTLEKTYRDKIVDHIDELQKNDPKTFDGLVFGFWKNKNNLPSDYFETAHFPNNASVPIDDLKNEFKMEHGLIKQRHDKLLERIRVAYENAGGHKTIRYEEAKKVIEKKDDSGEKLRIEAENKFRRQIQPLVAPFLEKYDSVTYSQLGTEVDVLNDKITEILAQIEHEQEETQKILNQESSQKIQGLKNAASEIMGTSTPETSKDLSPDVQEYIKDFYLTYEVFKSYDGIADSASEIEMNALAKDPKVKEVLDGMIAKNIKMEGELAIKVQVIAEEYEAKLAAANSEIESKFRDKLSRLQEELKSKKAEYDRQVEEAFEIFFAKFKEIWNTELEKLGSDTPIKPME